MSDKCELCEMRDQEVKKLVRAKRRADELIDDYREENEKLQADVRALWQELQVLTGRTGRSAQFSAAQAMAGIEWLDAEKGEIYPQEDSPSKEGWWERLGAHFRNRNKPKDPPV